MASIATLDLPGLKANLETLSGAIQRASGELAAVEQRAGASFEAGDAGGVAAAFAERDTVRARITALQQERAETEAALLAAAQPKVEAWKTECERQAKEFRDKASTLAAKLSNQVAELERTLDELGNLPEGKSRLLQDWGKAWGAVANEAAPVTVGRPGTPPLQMPDIGEAMAKLQKTSDLYGPDSPARPSLARFLRER